MNPYVEALSNCKKQYFVENSIAPKLASSNLRVTTLIISDACHCIRTHLPHVEIQTV